MGMRWHARDARSRVPSAEPRHPGLTPERSPAVSSGLHSGGASLARGGLRCTAYAPSPPRTDDQPDPRTPTRLECRESRPPRGTRDSRERRPGLTFLYKHFTHFYRKQYTIEYVELCSFLWSSEVVRCVVDPGLCGSTNTERAASRATAQNKKKSRLVVETERAVEWGLRPALSIRHDDVSWPANRTHLVLCAAGERGVKQRRHTEAGGKQNCAPKRVRVPFRQAWR